MLNLSAQDIANFYTVEQIRLEIVDIQTAIKNARQSRSDSFDDVMAKVKVERQNLTELNNTLAIWLKAWSIKTGQKSATAELISADYNPKIERI